VISPAARGRRAERAAAVLLRLRGLRVLDRNLRIRGAGEIDVLARSGSTLVVVEVKARRRGEPAEAVGPERQRALRRCGEVLLAEPANAWAQDVRFDVVAVTGLRFRFLRDAF
jgi:putative endonuclease